MTEKESFGMLEFERLYQQWLEKSTSREIVDELASLAGNTAEIKDRFYRHLDFGTGGMRGLVGAGVNRINIYTIRKTTLGLVSFLAKQYPRKNRRVVIAYDSRCKSREFALEAALVLAAGRVQALLFREMAPTPLLSFAVRELRAAAGIVITASHNPKEYNGYKVYADHGGQITDRAALAITREIRLINDEFAVEIMEQKAAEKAGLLVWLGDEILDKYLTMTKGMLFQPDLIRSRARELKIVYTPLYGTGLKPIQRLLAESGFTALSIVREQAEADPDFPGVVCPNPEDRTACALALKQAMTCNADLILATDPDADRAGIIVRDRQNGYLSLTGNQTGALLIDYLLRMHRQRGTLPANGVIVKTIVTSGLGAAIARQYGVACEEVLPGFKYIGEKIHEYELQKSHAFLFGYEESYGSLAGVHVRDKDGLQTCLLAAEMALYYRTQGLSLADRLEQLYEELGCHAEDLLNLHFTGAEGQRRIKQIMNSFRASPPQDLHKWGLLSHKDYLTGTAFDCRTGLTSRLELPRSDVLYYSLAGGAWCCIRPSGTEPKLKVYLGAVEKDRAQAAATLYQLKRFLLDYLQAGQPADATPQTAGRTVGRT